MFHGKRAAGDGLASGVIDGNAGELRPDRSIPLAVIAAAFGFVLWFQNLHTTKARSPLRVVFEGPASGT